MCSTVIRKVQFININEMPQTNPKRKSQNKLFYTLAILAFVILVGVFFEYKTSQINSVKTNIIDTQQKNKVNNGQNSTVSEPPTTQNNHQPQTKRELLQVTTHFNFPKIAWFFNHQPQKSLPHQSFQSPFKQLYQLNRLNNLEIAQNDNYNVNIVSSLNYSNYLSEQSSQQINKVIRTLQSRYQGKLETKMYEQMVHQTHNITKRLIVYFLMKQKGGVFIDDRVTLVESLDSMFLGLGTNRDINVGNLLIDSEEKQSQRKGGRCFGFYNQMFSSVKERSQFLIRRYEVEKTLVKYPNIEDYFIACETNNPFMQKITQLYAELLLNESVPQQVRNIDTNERIIGITDKNRLYEHGHYITAHVLMQLQQQKIKDIQLTQSFVIDELGLITINSRLGPTKLQTQFVLFGQKTINYLNKLTEDQIQLINGKFKYVFYLEEKVVKLLIEQYQHNQNSTHFVVKDSFAHKFWFSKLKKPQNQLLLQKLGKIGETITNYQVMKETTPQSKLKINIKQNVKVNKLLQNPLCSNCHHRLNLNTNQHKWQSLQKNVWVIWDNGIQKSNFIVEMCYQNLKLSAQKSNFTINLVSKQNVKDLISQQLIGRINHAIQNAFFDLSNQAISDLWRLALVYQHGGVYFDASTFQIDEKFQWILNVTQFPRQLIWNRYGNQPDVFMLWNSYYGSPLDWHYDKKHDTRSQWHLSYENNFIAAVKGSQLIKQWLEVMMEWIQLPFDMVWKEMEGVEMTGYCWTYDRPLTGAFRYLTAMDSVKYIIGRRQKLLKQQASQNQEPMSASHYYKIWSMPGQMIGQQKFRGQTNYENLDYRSDKETTGLNNIYRYKYAFRDVEGPLGPTLYQVKFFGYDLIYMNKYINDFYSATRQIGEKYDLSKLDEAFHPESVLAEKLFKRFSEKIRYCLQKYYGINEIKLRMKASNKIWTY